MKGGFVEKGIVLEGGSGGFGAVEAVADDGVEGCGGDGVGEGAAEAGAGQVEGGRGR